MQLIIDTSFDSDYSTSNCKSLNFDSFYKRLSHYAVALNSFYNPSNPPKNYHTTSTDAIDIRKLYLKSAEFRGLMESGMYVHISDKICLYTPEILKSGSNPNELHMSESVVKKPEDFCLMFESALLEPKEESTTPSNASFVREDPLTYGSIKVHNPLKAKELEAAGINIEDLNMALRDVLPRSVTPNKSAATTMHYNPLEVSIKKQLDCMGTSLKSLADSIGISEATIERFWTRPDSRPKIENVIAVCIGLQMPPTSSEYVIEAAGYRLRNTPQERVYRALINIFYNHGIQICNNILLYLGLTAMTPVT